MKRWGLLLVSCMVFCGGIVMADTMPSILINEVGYNTPSPESQTEWFELHNTTMAPINLSGWTITEKKGSSSTNTYTFGNVSIAAGQYFVVVNEASFFQSAYPGVMPDVDVDGVIFFRLSNVGDYLELKNPQGDLIDRVEWGNVGNRGINSLSDTPICRKNHPLVDTNNVSDRKTSCDATPGHINTPPPSASYQIAYYQQDMDGISYPAVATYVSVMTGFVDANVDALSTLLTGYTYDADHAYNIQTGTVLSDNSLVLKRYYRINTYVLDFEENGGTNVMSQTGIVYTTTGSQPVDPLKTGYVFSGWYMDAGLMNIFDFGASIVSDTVAYAKWVPLSNIPYTVHHYVGQSSGYDSTPALIQYMTGTTDAVVTGSLVSLTGYSYVSDYDDQIVSGVVLADGSLTLKLYYDRIALQVSFDGHNGQVISSGAVWYGDRVTPIDRPVRSGYTFVCRKAVGEESCYDFSSSVVEDVTLVASYVKNISLTTLPATGAGG